MIYQNFDTAHKALRDNLIDFSQYVHTTKWQGMDIQEKPEMGMKELLDIFFKVPLYGMDLQRYREDIKPNIPWADDHFEERVCGLPINPGTEWENWPYSNSARRFLDEKGQFNHNYMERFWPKHGIMEAVNKVEDAEIVVPATAPVGLRHGYGDLDDVVALLAREPDTRQAFFPVWFPEDTGVTHGGRVPCTIGYQFLMRNNFLHMVYYIRSCDFTRHFKDDVYLAVRLLLWVLNRLRSSDDNWKQVKPGFYSMHIMNLHVFKNDFIGMKNEN